MLTEKTQLVRRHILEQLEMGELQAGQRIPPARELARRLDTSFLKVQQAFETLAQDGIVEARTRQGTFVRARWWERLLYDNVSAFSQRHRLPWWRGLETLLQHDLPQLRFSFRFPESMVELKTTLYVQANHEQFIDLAEVFAEFFDPGEFFEAPFAPFRIAGRQVGIPVTFSPRVIYFNPEVFRRAGCERPERGWTHADLLACVAKLKTLLPPGRIFNWYIQPHMWLPSVHGAGGNLFAAGEAGEPLLDAPEARLGLRCFAALGDALGRPDYDEDAYVADFIAGKAAMYLAGRQFTGLLTHLGCPGGWQAAPLPCLPGGRPVSTQSTDLIVVRKACADPALVRGVVRFMLGEQAQDFFAAQNYGIPIRRSSAALSLRAGYPADRLFAQEIDALAAVPPQPCGEALTLLLDGTDRLLTVGEDLDAGTHTLAEAARVLIRTRNFRQGLQQERLRRLAQPRGKS